MTRPAESPYQVVLGPGLVALHPRLRAYFGAIPAGSHGVGSGVFEVVGTPRRWLWPALWVLERQGVLFPVWERGVPFTVTNRPILDASGRVAVVAVRTFHLPAGDASMVDTIAAEPGGLVDHLGFRRRYMAKLDVVVADGALAMTSTAMRVRLGPLSVPIPRLMAPRVRLVERFDEAEGLQRVAVTVDAPLLGRLYEYAGSFRYELRQQTGGGS